MHLLCVTRNYFLGTNQSFFINCINAGALTISVIWWKPILKRCLSRTGAGALLCSWPVHPSSRICLKRFQTRLNLVLPWCILIDHDLAKKKLSKRSSFYIFACRWLLSVRILIRLLNQLVSGGRYNVFFHNSHWFSINHVTSKRWMPVGEAGYVYHFPLQWGEVCFVGCWILWHIVSGFKTSSCP